MVRQLRAARAQVAAEYYINDAGLQDGEVRALDLAAAWGVSRRRAAILATHIDALAEPCGRQARPGVLDLPEDEAVARDRRRLPGVLAAISTRSTPSCHLRCGSPEGTARRRCGRGGDRPAARAKGHVEDRDGAIWLRTTDFGDDKDRVSSAPTASRTYFAADAAHYLSKKDRGSGTRRSISSAPIITATSAASRRSRRAPATTRSTISRSRSASWSRSAASGWARRGNALYLDDLPGVDRHRRPALLLARYPADSLLSLDGEELRRQTNDNPVFYVPMRPATGPGTANGVAAGGSRGDRFGPGLSPIQRKQLCWRSSRTIRGSSRRRRRNSWSRTASRAISRSTRGGITSGTTPAGSGR